jgi:hypothetical protein
VLLIVNILKTCRFQYLKSAPAVFARLTGNQPFIFDELPNSSWGFFEVCGCGDQVEDLIIHSNF